MTTDTMFEHPYSVLLPPNRVRLRQEDVDRIGEALHFLRQFNPLVMSPEELEMAVMHTAFLVNEHNQFENNWNIEPSRRKTFMEHMSHIIDTDISAWCRRCFDYAFWRFDNYCIINVLWNWLHGTLDEPKGYL